MRISDWSSDVCSSELHRFDGSQHRRARLRVAQVFEHHRAAPDLSDRVGDAFAGDVRRRTVHRFEQARKVAQIGSASCRERVCQYVKISVVAGSLYKKNSTYIHCSPNLLYTVIL